MSPSSPSHTHGPVVAILQARMSSSRLPGKVLKPLAGHPMLLQQIRRVQRCQCIDTLVVATSDRRDDTPIEDLCRAHDIPCFRGSLGDVLDRFYHAARAHRARTIVRLTGDCPLADPHRIDELVTLLINRGADYATNCIPPQLPHGLDAEAFTMASLEKAWKTAKLPSEREHVTPYMREEKNGFTIAATQYPPLHAHHRWCVDEPEDFQLVEAVYQALYPANPEFTTQDVLDLMTARPELLEINGHIDSRTAGILKDREQDTAFLTRNS